MSYEKVIPISAHEMDEVLTHLLIENHDYLFKTDKYLSTNLGTP